MSRGDPSRVIPAQAGSHLSTGQAVARWVPAFAGMTGGRSAYGYGATVTGVRSWNQLCACTKPFTFGDMARGFRS
jgi:hypothetical protein